MVFFRTKGKSPAIVRKQRRELAINFGKLGAVLFSLAGFNATTELIIHYGTADWTAVELSNLRKFYCWETEVRQIFVLSGFSLSGLVILGVSLVLANSLYSED